MKKRTVKAAGRIGCAVLAFVIAMSSGGTAFASASSTQKDETVYSTLDANGQLKSTTVSDWLHSDSAAAKFLDKSDLENIKNVKSNENPTKDGGNLIWQLDPASTDKTGSNIYYEGTTSKKLPITVSVAYYLDGKEIKPAQLAGKSGKVEIKINIKNNEEHTVNINGKNTTMYTPMTAIVLTTLPTDTFKNIDLSDGKLVSDGKNQFVTFVTMPGLNDSLNLKSYSDIPELSDMDFPEELDIKADVTNFSLDTIAVAATPELIDSDKLKNSTDIGEMRTNLNKLKKIQDDIENVDSDKSIRSLFTNPDRTAAARLLIDDVFDFYKLDLKMTDLATDYVTNDNIKLYDRITSDLDKADVKYLLDNKVIRGLNGRLTDENINKGRTLLKDYDDIETFDMVKFNRVVKALNHYDKLYDKFDGIFNDARRIQNHLNSSTLNTITALSGSGIQTDLSNTMESLNGLSNSDLGKLVTSGKVKLDDSDLRALIANYLERDDKNFEAALKEGLEDEAKNGKIAVKTLTGLMSDSDLKNDIVTQLTQYFMTTDGNSSKTVAVAEETAKTEAKTVLSVMQSSIMSKLSDSFIENNPDAEISAQSLTTNLKSDEVINATTLSYIEHAISITPGIVGSNGEIKVSSLMGALPQLKSALSLSDNQINDLTSQVMPIVIAQNSDAVISVDKVVSAFADEIGTINSDERAAVIKGFSNEIVKKAVPIGTASSLNYLLNNAGKLQAALRDDKKGLGKNYAGRLEDAFDNLSDEQRYIKDLQDDLKNITDEDDKDKDKIDDDLDEMEDVIKDKDQTDYLIGWANKIKGMKNDLDGNSENIGIMRDLLKQYDDPKIKNAKNMIPTLQNDIDDARPVLESLKDRLDEPAMNASLHKLPETTKTLLKMKNDIDSNRAIMNIFQKTMAPSTVSVFKNTFDTLDDFKKDGTVGDYTKKLDDADDLIAKKDAYIKLSDDYKIFTQSADGAKTKLKFVMKTAEIKAPDKVTTAKSVSTSQDSGTQSSGGFAGWVKSVWSGTVKLFKNIF